MAISSSVGRSELCEFRRSLNAMPELAKLGPAYDYYDDDDGSSNLFRATVT